MKNINLTITAAFLMIVFPQIGVVQAQEKSCQTTLECAQMMVEIANELQAEVKQLGAISAETKKQLDALSPRVAANENNIKKIRVIHGPTSFIGAGDHNLAHPLDSTICTLTGIRGKWEGGGEFVYVYGKNGMWHLRVNTHQPAVAATVMCFGRPN